MFEFNFTTASTGEAHTRFTYERSPDGYWIFLEEDDTKCGQWDAIDRRHIKLDNEKGGYRSKEEILSEVEKAKNDMIAVYEAI